MDTRWKNSPENGKKGMLYALLAALVPAVVMLCFYPYFAKHRGDVGSMATVTDTAVSRDEDGYEISSEDTGYIYDSGYVLYEDLQKKKDSTLTESDIFLPGKDLASMDEVAGNACYSALKNVLINMENSYSNLSANVDYLAMDTATGQVVSNVAEHRDVLKNYVDETKRTESQMTELASLYSGWICLDYSDTGDVTVSGSAGVSTKSFYREFQDLAHAGRFDRMINDFLENTDVTELSVQYPVNMRVFYGFNTLSADAAWDTYVTMYNSYSSGIFPMLYVLLLAGVAVAAVLFMRRETYAFHNHWLFHLPLEVSFAGLCICISLYEGMLDMMISYLEGSWSNIDMLTGGAINFLCWVLVFGAWFVSASCIVPVGSLGPVAYVKKYSLIYRFFPFIKRQGKRFAAYVTDVDLTENMSRSIWKIVLVNGAVVAILCTMWFGGIFGVVIYSIFLFLWLRRYFTGIRKDYQAVLGWVRGMAAGDLNQALSRDVGIFEPLHEELSHIQQGFRQAVAEEVKSQKMKTELITNVSHDLKTPLTAIITYVDLLGQDNLTEEERKSYVDILARKSQRLKVLIEDLFEISKATTNNVTMNFNQVDIVNLLKQVRFEMEDKLNASGLDFRWSLPEEKVILTLDSQKTYRVFSNLLTNIVKYALPRSRVYIDLKCMDGGQVVVTMKNISAAELNFDPREITERFVRGDLSRNTEGSGLGLAIASSFVELQGGTLDIEIDGDLFKAIVVFQQKNP